MYSAQKLPKKEAQEGSEKMYSAQKLPKKEAQEGSEKWKQFLVLFGAFSVLAVVLVTAAVLVSLYYAGIVGGKKHQSCNFSIGGEVFPFQQTFKLLHFEEEGDVEQVTVQSNTSITVFNVSEGILVAANNLSYLFLHERENKAIIVDVENDSISFVSSLKRVGSEIKVSGLINAVNLTQLACTVLDDGVEIGSGGKLPLTLKRRGLNDALITIETKPLTTVIARRGSDELRLVLGKYTDSTKELQQCLQKRCMEYPSEKVSREPLWEELSIRPSALNFSAENLFGTFAVRNEEAVYMNSYTQGNFSISPFKHKFGQMTNFGRFKINKGSVMIDFADDKCGRGLYRSEAGDEYWMFFKKREAGIRRAADGVSLEWKNWLLQTSDNRLNIDFNSSKVHVDSAVVTNNAEEDCDKWTICSSSSISVKKINKCTTTESIWDVRTPLGNLNTESLGDGTYSHKGKIFGMRKPYEFVLLYDVDCSLGVKVGSAIFRCDYDVMFLLDDYMYNRVYEPEIRMSATEKIFIMHTTPGHVTFHDGAAEIHSFTANINVSHFPIHLY